MVILSLLMIHESHISQSELFRLMTSFFSSFCSSFVRPRRVQNHKHLWDERKFKFQLREKTTNSLMSWIGNLVDAKSDSMWVVSLFSFSPDLNNENFLCKLNFFLYCCMLLRYSDDDNLGHELCEGNRNFVKFMFSHVNKMSRRDWRHDEESECIEFFAPRFSWLMAENSTSLAYITFRKYCLVHWSEKCIETLK